MSILRRTMLNALGGPKVVVFESAVSLWNLLQNPIAQLHYHKVRNLKERNGTVR